MQTTLRSNHQNARRSYRFLIVILASVFSGCTMLQPELEEPRVEVIAIRMLPTEGNVPKFEIGLRVINPNDRGLQLRGISYAVNIENRQIIAGAANNLPEIPAYGEARITLTAALSLIDGLQLIADLLQDPRDVLNYELNAKLDVGAIIPDITISETGTIPLGDRLRL
jgi:LEA14-like dessication related protein